MRTEPAVPALQRLARRARLMATGILLCSAPVLLNSGCYGYFPLTKMIYRVNGEVTDYKLVHTLVMWVFVILPVYSIAMLVDAIVFNLIEFWTDERIEFTEVRREDGSVVAFGPGDAPNEAVLTLSRDGRVEHTIRFVREQDGTCRVLDEQGNIAGWVLPREDGVLVLADAERRPVRLLDPRDMTQLADASKKD